MTNFAENEYLSTTLDKAVQIILSIVVPVYNVEDYINKCLDSLIIDSGLMEQMEVLIINDGTPDHSAEMSREYVKRFPTVFRQIDKENGGHGSAWNLGLKEARGKYVRFLDSDDWLENLEQLIERLKDSDADLVITPTICHLPKNKKWKLKIRDMQFGQVYDADSFDWCHNRTHRNFVLHHCCTYKTIVLRQHLPLFLEKQPYDDMILSPVAIIGAKSLVAYNFVLYHYLMNRKGQSISYIFQNRNRDAKIRSQQAVIDFVETHPVPETSSKHAFFQKRLPKMYSFGYKELLKLPYKEAKMRIKAWDEWTQFKNPLIQNKWISLYQSLPFSLYWYLGRLFL